MYNNNNLENEVNEIIRGYNNKPNVSIMVNGNTQEIHLQGGHYAARQDVEDYFADKNMLAFVSNSPQGKIIGLKLHMGNNPAKTKEEKKMKAYIVSEVNGTVQIGDTCFQPCTNSSFKASRKNLKSKPVYEVSEKSMEAAKQAIQLHAKNAE